jgi:methionyl-tRNA synthetase
MSQRVHITTAIFYSNGLPHVGSAYEALAADVFARYQRRKLGADNVSFLSGTDEHGDKIRRAALAQGLAPKLFTDKMSELFREAFAGLNVSFDYWVRTTDPDHEAFVQQMLEESNKRGNIYFRNYEGLYCVDCERFYAERELLPGNICPSHNKPVELISEGNYFLKIEQYRERVRDHIRGNPDFIRPERYRNEALNMLAEPLNDLCISRPKSRMDWGIELPFDKNYVTYVWYDAFWAYVSRPAAKIGLETFKREVWPHTEHFIGKDILKTHAVYWPPMLYAAGWEGLFKHLNVHGWLNFGGSRMSKSSGNVRDPVSYEKAFGPDVLRYFVMREMAYGLDGDFSEERLTQRYNADLANDLGNFTSRVLAMVHRYLGGELQAPPPSGSGEIDESWNTKTREAMRDLPTLVAPLIDELAFNRALEQIWHALDVANKHIANTQPFTLARDRANMPRVAEILNIAVENLRIIAQQLEPFMPITTQKIFDMLAVDDATVRKPYGEGLKPGHKVNPPTALFPRIEKTATA